MPTTIEVPTLGESISEAIVARWLKSVGEAVTTDEAIVELETDKITVEVPAPSAGVLTKQHAGEGDNVRVGEAIAEVDPEAAPSATATAPKPEIAAPAPAAPVSEAPPAPAAAPPIPAPPSPSPVAPSAPSVEPAAPPSARAEALRRGLDLDSIQGSGRGGRIERSDVIAAAQQREARPAAPVASQDPARPERVVPMTPLRKRIAQRLVQAQRDAAILTTFNEVDMSAVMEMRKQWKQRFVDRHETKLGFMSFFAKACVSALKAYPAVNAEIRGDDIVYKDYYDIGVAVGGGKGLVVPVVRAVDGLGFAAIEREIARLAGLAKTNKLQLSDLTGGSFTISNGGIYGSMLSTPILNPPQTGILGLHNITERAMVVNGQVVVRPMMYLALSYDHRLVDGREAVQFLVRIKECIEDPRRMLIDV